MEAVLLFILHCGSTLKLFATADVAAASWSMAVTVTASTLHAKCVANVLRRCSTW